MCRVNREVLVIVVVLSASWNLSAQSPRAAEPLAATGQSFGWATAFWVRPEPAVRTGLDVLIATQFSLLQGKRVALITHRAAVARDGRTALDVFRSAPDVKLVAVFTPEHGFGADQEGPVADEPKGDLPVPFYSLYGQTLQPQRTQLTGVDALVFDLQDVGCRFYTYISTLRLCMESAARQRVSVFVLDRPNPIGGVAVEGPVSEPQLESFTNCHPLPIRHGMTVGELARMFQTERQMELDLHVVPLRGWQRQWYLDETGLAWIHPSPNMRSLRAALVYPGVGLLETTNVSVGRGTETPFEQFGAPWIDANQLVAALEAYQLPGVHFTPVRFRPTRAPYAGEDCFGVKLEVTDRRRFEAVRTGLAIAVALKRLYPQHWQSRNYLKLLANHRVWQPLEEGHDLAELTAAYQEELRAFESRRARVLLYETGPVAAEAHR
jgi:uncharacterized protein YbbC (DUF1343 family)